MYIMWCYTNHSKKSNYIPIVSVNSILTACSIRIFIEWRILLIQINRQEIRNKEDESKEKKKKSHYLSSTCRFI